MANQFQKYFFEIFIATQLISVCSWHCGNKRVDNWSIMLAEIFERLNYQKTFVCESDFKKIFSKIILLF